MALEHDSVDFGLGFAAENQVEVLFDGAAYKHDFLLDLVLVELGNVLVVVALDFVGLGQSI